MKWIHEADGLIRLHAVGFLAVWPLLGAAAVSRWTPRLFLGLLVTAFFFNTFGAVLNDVVDLPVDRTNRLRANTPLVRGVVPRMCALTLGLLQIPLVVVSHLAAGFPIGALPLVLGALASMAVYDLWSKKAPVPPAIEASQAAAGTLLVLYGAAVTGGRATPLVWPTALSAAAFILLVNAFHGGLRDLENDIAHGQRTTPIWLGCGSTVDGRFISKAMSVYSASLLSVLTVLALWTAAHVEVASEAGRMAVLWVVTACVFVNGMLFVFLHRTDSPAWDVVLRAHVASLPVPLLLAFTPALGVAWSLALFAVYVVPLLALDRSHLSLAMPWTPLMVVRTRSGQTSPRP